jgi:hypothetical protein
MEDEGLEKQGALVDGIAFEYAGFLDRSRLSAVLKGSKSRFRSAALAVPDTL